MIYIWKSLSHQVKVLASIFTYWQHPQDLEALFNPTNLNLELSLFYLYYYLIFTHTF